MITIEFDVKFDGNFLNQKHVIFTHKQVVSIYTAYDTNLWPFNVGQDFTQKKSLFGGWWADKKDPDNYKYSGYGIGFDVSRRFSLSDGSGFGADPSYMCILIIRKKLSWFLVKVQHKD